MFVHSVLIFWYFSENFHSDLVSLSIDIIGKREPHSWNLVNDEKVDLILLGISAFFMAIKMILFFIFIAIVSRPSSKMHFLLRGIKSESKPKVFIFFIHFISTWIILACLVLLTPWVSSKFLLVFAAAI